MAKKNDWDAIKAEYIRGGTSYRKLADKYDVSFSILRKRASKEKWTDLRSKKEQKRDTKIVKSIADQEARTAIKLRDTTELLLNKIAKQIEDAKTIVPSDVSAYMVALERAKRICDLKSAADIEEQKARIDKLRKEASSNEENKEIKVVIDDSLSEFSK